MSTEQTGFSDLYEGAEPVDAAVPSELRALLTTISHQIDAADQRHTGLLQEMRDRLVTLSRNAEHLRATVPEHAETAYARIEDSLNHLAQRLDTMDHIEQETLGSRSLDQTAPAALKSAAVAQSSPEFAPVERPQAGGNSSGIDPFDLVGEPGEDEGEPAWDQVDAEALTRIYEESDAALIRRSPRSEQEATPEPTMQPEVEGEPLPARHALHEPLEPRFGDFDRDWLDQRLSEIAARIEQSMADLMPDLSIENLGSRFDAFEERMGSVLGDVASRSDVESLRMLEAQINDLATHVEQAERQLGRLDSIEQQLQAVVEHLSEAPAGLSGETVAHPEPDFQSLASIAAEHVAERFAGNGAGASHDLRFDEINRLLRNLMEDRRQNDEQTYTMLDTVQQAMIRLLDRIDALELSQARSHNEFGAPSHRHTEPATEQASQSVAEPESRSTRSVQGSDARSDLGNDSMVFSEALQGPDPVSHMPQTEPGLAAVASPVDKLRQDFIADAQRAKMRAAATSPEAAPETEAAATTPPRLQTAARGLPRAKMPAPEAAAADLAGIGSRKQRLTALALCLVIAVSGAALFMKSRTQATEPAAPAAVTNVAPKATDDNNVPSAAEAPAQIDGAAFEAPADDEAFVPAPAPSEGATVPHAGGAPAADDDVMGLENDVPANEDVLQNKPQAQAPGIAAEGIVLQAAGRYPTAQELVHLQDQKNAAALSSRLGSNASLLSPADLMPEEVAKLTVKTGSSANSLLPSDMMAGQSSYQMASLDGQSAPMASPALSAQKAANLNLPPATVGPLSLRLAAANGDPSAAFEVGARLAEGKGTDQNFKEAVTWYQRSASQGFAQAQYRLGTLYERGLGVKADAGRARMWYQRAAQQGNVKAMHNLAVLSAGRESGSPDYTSAAQWFTSAAEHGLADSQYNLAVLYENGLGVAKSPDQAFIWYSLAAKSGDKEAIRRRDAIEAQLTVAKRDEALRTVAAFRAKRTAPIVNDPRVAGEDWKKREGAAGNG